jgi:hypothetical protein
MAEAPLPTGPDVGHLMVPEDLLRQYHEAVNHLQGAKEEFAKAQESSQYQHQQQVNEQMEVVRRAEKEVEELTAKVKEILERKV